jgi:hypothetical protein
MKKVFILGFMAALVFCGCQEELEINGLALKTFTASIEDSYSGGDTKTSLDGYGNVLWTKGDQVSVFDGSTVNVQYQVTDDSDGKTSASLNKVTSSGYTAGTEIGNNVAYYPYSSETELAKNGTEYVISGVTLPATQAYAQASFANGAFPMAAITGSIEDNNLGFKNVLGGLKLQLKGTAKIASISISGNADEILCGSANVFVSTTAVPEISLTDASAKTVTLNCGTEGVQLNADTVTPFIIALPPMTMESGFAVTVKDTDGKQMEIKTAKSQTITRSSLLKMPAVEYVGEESGDDSGDESGEIDYLKEPFTITSVGETSVSFVKSGSPADITLEYRKNSDDWAAYTIGDAIALADGDALQFRAGEDGNVAMGYYINDVFGYYCVNVTGDGNVDASGNVMSLLDRTLSKQSLLEKSFFGLFGECKKLVNAANLKLPATTLAERCYAVMFCECTGLTTAPKLPATTLAECCYISMFNGCTSLTTAPKLPATTLAECCYISMFNGCTSLTVAPDLPATNLANSCYSHMFNGCTGLTTAPKLPATTLAECCYISMFNGCTNLTVAPDLPATNLANSCYAYMFNGCTGLTTAPELPATTLASSCYSHMFYGCTSLMAAPDLLATNLEEDSYAYMFYNCKQLNYVKALFKSGMFYPTDDTDDNDEIIYNCSTQSWLGGVSSSGTFIKGQGAIWKTEGTSGVPSGWIAQRDGVAFSVSDDKKVIFTEGNLYWDGSAFCFETKQYQYPTTRNDNHIGYFYWTKWSDFYSKNAAYMPYATVFSSSGSADTFWCCEFGNSLTVNNISGYYNLSNEEWNYLFSSRANSKELYKIGVTVSGKSDCLIIAPDDYAGTIASTYSYNDWRNAESYGLVCLPSTYYCDASNTLKDEELFPGYWSSGQIDNYGSVLAIKNYYNNAQFVPSTRWGVERSCALPIRLVRNL